MTRSASAPTVNFPHQEFESARGETLPATPIEPPDAQQAAARLREFAVALLGYALGIASRSALDPEQAASLLADAAYRQPPPQIRGPYELVAEARSEASFLALLHGPILLEEQDGVFTQTVSLEADRAALERFGARLDHYAGWMAALDRARQRGLGRETLLEGHTLRRRLWLPGAANHVSG